MFERGALAALFTEMVTSRRRLGVPKGRKPLSASGIIGVPKGRSPFRPAQGGRHFCQFARDRCTHRSFEMGDSPHETESAFDPDRELPLFLQAFLQDCDRDRVVRAVDRFFTFPNTQCYKRVAYHRLIACAMRTACCDIVLDAHDTFDGIAWDPYDATNLLDAIRDGASARELGDDEDVRLLEALLLALGADA